jgi:gamma-glutamylcyclotransferase (GGCT)/AIG2-like uncharacterized protein YtfP
MSSHLVFVYGSLRRGAGGAMAGRFPSASFIGEATVSGRLYDLGAYPGLQLDESGARVIGEAYEVTDETLQELDKFEATTNYLRRSVEIYLGAQGRSGWTYEPNPQFYSLAALITSGDWIEHLRLRTTPR